METSKHVLDLFHLDKKPGCSPGEGQDGDADREDLGASHSTRAQHYHNLSSLLHLQFAKIFNILNLFMKTPKDCREMQ